MATNGNGQNGDGADGGKFPGDPSDEPMVFIILGEVRREEDDEVIPFNSLLVAPDDDTAVRQCLEALAQEGYKEADLHQIGNFEGIPDDEPYASAYQAAMEGEIAIIAYEGGYDFGNGGGGRDL